MTAPQELARIYVEAINGQPNGWGQYCHKAFGQSHNIMIALSNIVGDDECQRLIKEEMTKVRP